MVEQIRQGDIPGVQLRCRVTLEAEPARVWRWLTETGRMSRWLAQDARQDPDTAGAIVLEYADESGQLQRERWSTVVADPPRTWILDLLNLDGTWPTSTRVKLELTPSSQGAAISVLQTGFAHLPLSDCLTIWETYRRRWRRALSTLAESL